MVLPETSDLGACILCHNKTEMKVNYVSPDNLYTNYSLVSHYGKKRTDIYAGTETNCSYCHQATSGFNDLFEDINNTQITHNIGKNCNVCHREEGALDGRIHDESLIGGGGNDCIACHYKKDMNRSNVYLCDSCHTNSSGVVTVTDPSLIKSDFMHGMTTCKGCHAPTSYHFKGTVGPLGVVENI